MCVCTLKRVAFCARTTRCARNVSLPGRHSLTLGQYTTLPLFITFYSARVPRDSSLLCDRTITRPGIYASRRRRPLDVSSTRENTTTNRDRGREKKPSSSSSSFWYKTTTLSSFSRLIQSLFVFLGRFRAHLQRVQPFLVEFLFQERIHVSLSRHLFHALKFLGHHVQHEVRFRASIVLRRRVPRVPGVLPRFVDYLQHRRLQRRLKLATHRRRDGTADASHGRARGFSAPFTVGSDARHPRRRFLLNGEESFVAL